MLGCALDLDLCIVLEAGLLYDARYVTLYLFSMADVFLSQFWPAGSLTNLRRA